MRDLKDQEFIKQLLEAVTSASDKHRLLLMLSDHQKATNQLHGESSSSNRKNYLEAEAEYLKTVSEIANRYLPEETPENTEPTTFPTQKAAMEYLVAAGWKVSKSHFSRHCKEKLLRPESDGSYSQKACDKYAKTWLKTVATGQKVNERMDKMQEEKLEVDLRAAKYKMEEAEFNLGVRKNKFVPRDDFELAIVGRAVAFMAHLNHTIQTEAAEWIDIVGGDQTRAPELVAAISRAVEQRMGDFAADAEFDVILEAN